MEEKEVASMVAREEKRKSMCNHASALATLEDFRVGKIDESEWVSMINRFGRAYLIEARPDVERFLTSEKPLLRYTALHILTLYFKLQDHWKTAIDFLLYDPKVDVSTKLIKNWVSTRFHYNFSRTACNGVREKSLVESANRQCVAQSSHVHVLAH